MSEAAEFLALLARVRLGDPDAITELVRKFESPLRRAIRFRLSGGVLRGHITESDICQSVLGSLFVRVAAGEYELETENDLKNLLVRMAGNKLTDLTRRNTAVRRDTRRDTAADPDTQPAPAGATSPVQVVMGRELLEEVRRRLTPAERLLFERRAAGSDWAEIALEVGEAEATLRQRLARAVRRVEDELGFGSE